MPIEIPPKDTDKTIKTQVPPEAPPPPKPKRVLAPIEGYVKQAEGEDNDVPLYREPDPDPDPEPQERMEDQRSERYTERYVARPRSAEPVTDPDEVERVKAWLAVAVEDMCHATQRVPDFRHLKQVFRRKLSLLPAEDRADYMMVLDEYQTIYGD
jgi:hypothetical protein